MDIFTFKYIASNNSSVSLTGFSSFSKKMFSHLLLAAQAFTTSFSIFFSTNDQGSHFTEEKRSHQIQAAHPPASNRSH